LGYFVIEAGWRRPADRAVPSKVAAVVSEYRRRRDTEVFECAEVKRKERDRRDDPDLYDALFIFFRP